MLTVTDFCNTTQHTAEPSVNTTRPVHSHTNADMTANQPHTCTLPKSAAPKARSTCDATCPSTLNFLCTRPSASKELQCISHPIKNQVYSIGNAAAGEKAGNKKRLAMAGQQLSPLLQRPSTSTGGARRRRPSSWSCSCVKQHQRCNRPQNGSASLTNGVRSSTGGLPCPPSDPTSIDPALHSLTHSC